MRGAISKKRGLQPRWPKKVEGMERSKRARRRKLDTAKTDLKPPLAVLGGQGVHREMESEGHEEKYRAVIDGVTPKMNRSAKGGARSSLHFRGEGVLIHPPHQGDCGRHGTEEQRVTKENWQSLRVVPE